MIWPPLCPLTDHQVVHQLLRDPRLISRPPGLSESAPPLRTVQALVGSQLLFADGVAHDRLHQSLQEALARHLRDEATGRAIPSFLVALLRQAQERGTMEVVTDFARPLSTWVSARVLGLPLDERLRQWAVWSDAFADLTSGSPGDQQGIVRLQQAFLEIVATRKTHPGTVLGVLCAAPGISADQVAVQMQMLFPRLRRRSWRRQVSKSGHFLLEVGRRA